jgi:hypothetical protein
MQFQFTGRTREPPRPLLERRRAPLRIRQRARAFPLPPPRLPARLGVFQHGL